MSREGLDGQVCLVTGASSGIGRASCLELARLGADVSLFGRNAAELGQVAGIVRTMGRRALVQLVDFSEGHATRASVDATIAKFGRLDVIVSVAGTNLPRRALTVLDPTDWDRLLEINLSAAYHLTQAALPQMRRQGGGLLIYVSSFAVQRPDLSGVAYQASKHGLVGLAHGTMEEERLNGIRTTVIFPGLTNTPLVEKRPTLPPSEVLAKALEPADVARAIAFVATLPARARVPELQVVPSGL